METDKMSPYQVMPPLTEAEYRALRDDISANGVLIAIEMDEHGNILDGHHRLAVCRELGITDYPRVIRAGMSEEEKRAHARRLNMSRRHLTQEQKRTIIREQLKETPSLSDRYISAALGVSDKTVGSQRKNMIATAEIPQLLSTVGADGKERPRELKRTHVAVYNPSARETRALLHPEVVESMIENGSSSPKYTLRKLRQEKRKARENAPFELNKKDFRLHCANLRSGLYDEVEDSCLDLICTDAPYDGKAETLELWDYLGAFARRTLKPSGSLVSMAGVGYLPTVMEMLGRHLTFGWVISLYQPRAASMLHFRGIFGNWKPVLLYRQKGWKYDGELAHDTIVLPDDVIVSPPEELDKSHHKWQQSLIVTTELVRRFTREKGMVVCDPMQGSGTVGVACANLGMRYVGIDCDPETVETARVRIAEALKRTTANT